MRDPQMWANKMLSNALHIANTTAKGGIIAEKYAFDDERQAESSYAQPHEKPKRQPRASKRITMRQATNMMEAVAFAKSIDLPLVAHLTIHWAYTNVGDDPDGKRFAKVREGLDKWLGRRGIAFTAVWARERQSRGQSDVVHCHMLFHLPVAFRMGAKLRQVETALYRLIKRHGNDYWAEEVIKLVIHDNPDGKYLIKGGGREVWKRFRLRKERRHMQGLIHGKRCGTTESIGPTARRRWKERQGRKEGVREQ